MSEIATRLPAAKRTNEPIDKSFRRPGVAYRCSLFNLALCQSLACERGVGNGFEKCCAAR
jgi:hypothetical protein